MKDKEKLSELLKLMMQFRKKRKKPLFPVPNGLRIVHIPEFCRGTHIQSVSYTHLDVYKRQV